MFRRSALLWTSSIRQRILLAFIGVVITGTLLQLVVAGVRLQDTTFEFYRSKLHAHGMDLSAIMAEPLEHYVTESDNDALRRAIASMHGAPYNAFLLFSDKLDLISSTLTAAVEQFGVLTPELDAARETGTGFDVRVGRDGTERLYVAVPIRYETAYIGYLVVSQEMQPIRAEIASNWLTLGASLLPVVGGVVAVGIWVAATITRPVRDLHASAVQMAGGDLNVRTHIGTNDEIGALGQAFNAMAEHVSTLLRVQKDFVSNAAHELRTPLMTMSLRIEALAESGLSQAQRGAYLDELREESRHMAELIEALLTLSRLDEGRWAAGDAACDSGAVLHDSAREWRRVAAQNGVRLDLTVPDNLPDAAIPATDLRLIFDNLLGNAVKYTPAGTVTVRAASEGDVLRFTVADTGIGFTPEDGARLFDRFFRADAPRYAHLPGTGLGLAVVQTLVTHWGGRVAADSPGPGRGTTMTVTIPAAPVGTAARAAAPAPA